MAWWHFAVVFLTVVAYVAIGTWACVRGPLRRQLQMFRIDMSLSQDFQVWAEEEGFLQGEPGVKPVARWRWWSVWLLVHAMTLLGWPLFLRDAMRVAREQQRHLDAFLAKRTDQRLNGIGLGGGKSLKCNVCGHAQVLPGDIPMHRDGYVKRWVSPWQCMTCNQFVAVASDDESADGHCECGGLLGRDHLTLCPVCASEDVKLSLY